MEGQPRAPILFDRLRREQHRLHELGGRVIIVFLGMLAVIQFAVLDFRGPHAISQGRLVLIATGLALFWVFVPWVAQLRVARKNPGNASRERMRLAWKHYGLLVWFSMLLPGLVLVAGATGGNRYDWNLVGKLLLLAFALDVGGFFLLQAARAWRWFLYLLPFRFIVASVLAVQGATIGPTAVSNADRAFALWPTIAAAAFAQWTVWATIQYARQVRWTDSLQRIVTGALQGTIPPGEIPHHYDKWLREAVLDGASDADVGTHTVAESDENSGREHNEAT